ncbi:MULTISPECIES: universal stress protein [Mycolicibacterium]|uniref:Universal stress protein n=2 Tax=Mycolicibacterium TaxID=1866885 RepID=A0A9X3BWC2_9MYCO|nr:MULTISPECIES: universal stress protein [Mycolicibacterium]MCV7170297.1 universal stress protein [[Mycobacterium] manitobense]MDO3637622.1 universal stress protein [Mycolicibacterium arseniciresistens]
MIVVGYSADEFGRAALEHGITEAKRRDTGLLVINATSGESYVDKRFAQESEVHDVEARLTDCGVPFELSQPVGVDAAEELVRAMDRDEAELLVIGLRHRNPVGKLLMGSVAQRVLLECPKPVLAVKPAEG